MDRREFFLNTAKASGVMLPWWGLLPITAHAQVASKILIYYHTDGGMCNDMFLDPSPDRRYNLYTQNGLAIPGSGNIRIAPAGQNLAFLNRFRDQMLVINGVNTESNSHTDGAINSATGKLMMGYAPLSELHAAKYAGGAPAGWMVRDGDTVSTGVYPATAVPDQNQLRAMVDPLASSGTTDYVKRTDFNKTVEARQARLEALKANGILLPKERLVTDEFLAAKEARIRLQAVAQNIPATFGNNPDIEVFMIAAQSGITAAGTIGSGGFDCHGSELDYEGNNGALTRMTNRLTFIWDEAARRGIADRLYVLVAGEFSRTPLNGSNGHDHQNFGAGALLMLPPGSGLGNRVVGYSATMNLHQSRTINPKTGAPDPNGIVIKPAHYHDALRDFLGVQPTNPALGLGVPASEKLNLFSTTMSTGYPELPA